MDLPGEYAIKVLLHFNNGFQDSMQRNSGTLDVPLPKPEAQKVIENL